MGAGEVAELGVQTFEPFLVSGGRFTLRYNASLAAGPAVVKLDQRYGKSTFTVDRSKPGRLVVNFQSSNKTLQHGAGNDRRGLAAHQGQRAGGHGLAGEPGSGGELAAEREGKEAASQDWRRGRSRSSERDEDSSGHGHEHPSDHPPQPRRGATGGASPIST